MISKTVAGNRHISATNVTQYNTRYILSTFEDIEIFALYNRRCNKLFNDTKFIKIGVILFENTSLTMCEFILIFFIFYTLFCSLSQNKPGRQNVPFVVYWVTNVQAANRSPLIIARVADR